MPTDQDLALKQNMSVVSGGPAGLDADAAIADKRTPEEIQAERLKATGRAETVDAVFRFFEPLVPPTVLATAGYAAARDKLTQAMMSGTIGGTRPADLAEAKRARAYWSGERKAADVESKAAQRALEEGDELRVSSEYYDEFGPWDKDVRRAVDAGEVRDLLSDKPATRDPWDMGGYRRTGVIPGEQSGSLERYSQFYPADYTGPAGFTERVPLKTVPEVVRENLDLARARAKIHNPSPRYADEAERMMSHGGTPRASQLGASRTAAFEKAIGRGAGVAGALAVAAPLSTASEVQRRQEFETVLTNMALHNIGESIPKGVLSKETLDRLRADMELADRLFLKGVLSEAVYRELVGEKVAQR